jgi:uncharacterized membrane-anchored protein YhcB (DUF1043 family)
MEAVWIAFSCGIFLGMVLGVLILGLVSINRDNKLRDDIMDLNGEIDDLRTQRELLKKEIFRLTKRGKPQPRKRRPYKKNYKKN